MLLRQILTKKPAKGTEVTSIVSLHFPSPYWLANMRQKSLPKGYPTSIIEKGQHLRLGEGYVTMYKLTKTLDHPLSIWRFRPFLALVVKFNLACKRKLTLYWKFQQVSLSFFFFFLLSPYYCGLWIIPYSRLTQNPCARD